MKKHIKILLTFSLIVVLSLTTLSQVSAIDYDLNDPNANQVNAVYHSSSVYGLRYHHMSSITKIFERGLSKADILRNGLKLIAFDDQGNMIPEEDIYFSDFDLEEFNKEITKGEAFFEENNINYAGGTKEYSLNVHVPTTPETVLPLKIKVQYGLDSGMQGTLTSVTANDFEWNIDSDGLLSRDDIIVNSKIVGHVVEENHSWDIWNSWMTSRIIFVQKDLIALENAITNKTVGTYEVNYAYYDKTSFGAGAPQGKISITLVRDQKNYNVTYTDGVDDEVIFEDKVFTVEENTVSPLFEDEITRLNYKFIGWSPEVAPTVTEDITYTALWERVEAEKPIEENPKDDNANKDDKGSDGKVKLPQTGINDSTIPFTLVILISGAILLLSSRRTKNI